MRRRKGDGKFAESCPGCPASIPPAPGVRRRADSQKFARPPCIYILQILSSVVAFCLPTRTNQQQSRPQLSGILHSCCALPDASGRERSGVQVILCERLQLAARACPFARRRDPGACGERATIIVDVYPLNHPSREIRKGNYCAVVPLLFCLLIYLWVLSLRSTHMIIRFA